MINTFDESKVSMTMNSLNKSLKLNEHFTELTKDNIDTIKYNGYDIKTSISGLSVVTASITRNGKEITPADVTSIPGTVNVTYNVSFSYSGNPITKIFTQTINVTN